MAFLRCIEPFATPGRVPRVVTSGEIVDADDPAVKGNESKFEPVETFMARRGGAESASVEIATATPGEKRTRSRAKPDKD